MPNFNPNIQLGADFSLSVFGDLSFGGSFQTIEGEYKCAAVVRNAPSLSKILRYVGVPDIPWLPDIRLAKLAAVITVTEEQQDIEVAVTLDASEKPIAISFVGNEQVSLNFGVLDFSCHFTHAKGGKTSLNSCNIVLDKSNLKIPDVLDIDSFNLSFSYSEKESWKLYAGAPKGKLFGTTVDADISYGSKDHRLSINFCRESTLKLLDIAGFELTATDMGLEISSEKEKTHIKVRGRADLTLPAPLDFSFGGTLILADSSLILEPSAERLDLSILKFPLDSDTPAIDFGLSAGFKSVTLSWGENAGISASASMEWILTGIPTVLTDQLPLDIDVTLGIRKDEELGIAIELKATNNKEIKRFTIPDIDIGSGSKVELSQLGGVLLRLQELGISVSGKGLMTQLKLKFALPEDLNDIFKKDADSEPAIKLFDTDPIDLVAEFGILDSKPSFSVQLWECPFLPEWISDKQETVNAKSDSAPDWHLKLGTDSKYGEIKVNSPKFECNFEAPPDLTFEGDIDLSVEKELRIPLTLLQNFLSLFMELDRATQVVPDSLPIMIPTLLDDDGRFASEELVHFLEESLNIDRDKAPDNPLISVLDDIESVLNTITKHTKGFTDKIPPRLKTYLEPQFAQGFEGVQMSAKASLRADATFDFDISMDADSRTEDEEKKKVEGVRLLMFCPSIPPALQGFTIRRLAFGTVFGDLLFRAIIDCDFDQFDLIGLAASVALPEDTILPISRDIQQTLIVRNLKALIEYETAVPIPIPYYFDEIGYDYSDLLGFGIHGHILLKRPHLDLGKLFNVFTDSLDFVTKPEARLSLDPKDLTDMLPALQLSNCYLQYPEFIDKDGGYLGYKDPDEDTPYWTSEGIEGEVIKYIQDTLNTIKFFSIVEFVKSIPQEQRCKDIKAEQNLTFAGLSFQAELGWLLTTPEDFNLHEKAYVGTIGEAAGLKAMAELVLGTDWSRQDAAIIFLKTAVDVEPLAGLDMRFALVTTNFTNSTSVDGEQMRNGVATAFHLHGNILALSIDLKAALLIQTQPDLHIHANGTGQITFGSWDLFTCQGEVDIREDGFMCSGSACVLPDRGTDIIFLNQKCEISKKSGVDISLTLDSLSIYGLYLFSLDFRAFHSGETTSITYKGSCLGASVTLEVDNNPNRLSICAEQSFLFGGLSDNTITCVLYWNDRTGTSVLEGSFLDFLGPLATSYKASFNNQNGTKDDLLITLMGGHIISLHTKLKKGDSPKDFEYVLSGSFDLFPPNFPVKCGSRITGGAISATGIRFTSRSELNILGTGVDASLTFDEAKFAIQAGIKVAGAKITDAGGMVTIWKNAPAFCLSYTTRFLWWTTRWYIGVSIDGLYLSTSAPGYWKACRTFMKALSVEKRKPMLGSFKKGLLAEPLLMMGEDLSPKGPPRVDGLLILDIIKNLLETGEPGVSTLEGLKKFEGVFFLYKLRVEEITENETKLLCLAAAQNHSPRAASVEGRNFFAEAIEKARPYIQQDEMVEKLESIDSVQFIIDRKAAKINAVWFGLDQKEIASSAFNWHDIEESCMRLSESIQ